MNKGITTRALHSSYKAGAEHGAVIPPLHLSTTFAYGNAGGFEYSRSGNPTRQILEQTLAELEGGTYGLAYSSGSAALANVAALLQAGEEILFSTDAYGGTYRYVTQVLAKHSMTYRICDFTDLEATGKLLAAHPIKIVWLETPTNPLLKVTDIAALSQLAHQHGAVLVVDNTFATPVLQTPLALGADMVAYSTTKYMNGHSDSVGGALVVQDESLYQRLKFLQNATGAILSPFDSWLTLRGLRTLELRMKRHTENATLVRRLLEREPKVQQVYYPGSASAEQAAIARQQMRSLGGMVSFELADGYDAQRFVAALHYFPLAESLGGVESLLDHPASMTHAAIPAAERKKIGLSDGLFRLSVGIEDSSDLLADLRQAFKRL